MRIGLSGCAGPWGPPAWNPYPPCAVGLLPILQSPPGEGAQAAPTLFCCPRHHAEGSTGRIGLLIQRFKGQPEPQHPLLGTSAQAPSSACPRQREPRRTIGTRSLKPERVAIGRGADATCIPLFSWGQVATLIPKGLIFITRLIPLSGSSPNYVSCLWVGVGVRWEENLMREAIGNSQEHSRHSLPWSWVGRRLVV